jgi:hypothetical protein
MSVVANLLVSYQGVKTNGAPVLGLVVFPGRKCARSRDGSRAEVFAVENIDSRRVNYA